MVNAKKKPCSRCPYTLGLIKTLTNPCPECRMNGYRSYERFQKQLSGEGFASSKGNRSDE